MGLKIKEVLNFGGLKDAEIVAGKGGLDNIIESISVLEVAEPNIAKWVQTNQLYITSFYAIYSNVEMQKEVIKALHKSGGCGLVICHFELYVKNVDKVLIDLSNELNFPLIIAKSEVSYVEILNPIIERLMHISADESKLLLSALNRLIEIVTNEGEIKDIFKNISNMFKGEILFFDSDHKSINSTNIKNKSNASKIEQYLKDNHYSLNSECWNKSHIYRMIEGKLRLVYPIKTVGMFYGFIIANAQDNNQDYSLKMIENIAKACTLIYSKKNRIIEMNEKYINDYINNVIEWNFKSEDECLKTGLELGIDITEMFSLIAVKINYIEKDVINRDIRNEYQFVKKFLYPKIVQKVKAKNSKNIIIYKNKTIFVLLQKNDVGGNKYDELILAEDLLKICGEVIRGSVSIGISDQINRFTEIPDAYRKAEEAAQLGKNFIGENKITQYGDLGFLTIINEIKYNKEAIELKSRILKPLQEYDKQNNTNLHETLEYLLESGANVSLTAEKMFLHKNTVLYRKNRIMEILGENPFEMPKLLDFMIAYALSKM
ncbi:MAG: PucR family transcriptional regulator [Clostridiaceae bacterium]